MGVHTAVDVLGSLLAAYGRGAGDVRSVTASTAGGDVLEAEAELSLPLDGGTDDERPRLLEANLTSDGRIAVEATPPRPPDLPDVPASISVSEEAVRLDGDGAVVLTLAVEIAAAGDGGAESGAPGAGEGTDGDPRDAATGVADPPGEEPATAESTGEPPASGDTDGDDRLAAVRSESVPPYEDVPYLKLLYETCDTFAEMRDRIEMDVSAETVRRYMIDAGVHEPASYETVEEADGQAVHTAATGDGSLTDEQLVTDGLGLPEDVQVAEVLDAVVEAATVHEVERRLGLGQERTRELLRELDLLDLVLHRVTDDPGRCTYEEAAMRVRRRASGGA